MVLREINYCILRYFIPIHSEGFILLIFKVVQMIISSGRDLAKREKSKVPLRYKWHEKNYYGAAHGVAGIVYLLLQVSIDI